MAQRAAGEGSVFQTSNGRWVAMIELPRRPNGKRHRKLRRARTRAEAQRKLRDMRRELDDFGSLPRGERRIGETLSDYIEQVRVPEYGSRKVAEREQLFADVITDYFGNRKTADVTVQDCDALLAAFVSGEVNRSGKPVGRDYVRRVRAFLAAALRNDIRQGMLNQNPAEVAVIPASSTKKKDRRALTVAEWRSLFDAATGVYRLVIDLGGRHGLRPQEVRAVRWSDVDLAEGVLSVVTQLDADDEFSDTKTIKSTRTLRLHPDTVVLVGKWSATQAKQRERAGDRWTDRNLIVATRWGTAIDQDNHRRSIKRLCERAGVEAITPYELRHTAITHQIEEGHTASQVADWAGTSEQMIYNHYRHKIREVSDLQPPSYH